MGACKCRNNGDISIINNNQSFDNYCSSTNERYFLENIPTRITNFKCNEKHCSTKEELREVLSEIAKIFKNYNF